jgi:hypothetical protein
MQRSIGWWNHYAAYTVHLVSILASFAASIIAATGELDKFSVATVAAIPGTLLAAHNVFKFENKCGWYYKKVQLLQHLLDRIKFEKWTPAQVSQELRKIDADMDLEWPGFGTVALRQDGGPNLTPQPGGPNPPPTTI